MLLLGKLLLFVKFKKLLNIYFNFLKLLDYFSFPNYSCCYISIILSNFLIFFFFYFTLQIILKKIFNTVFYERQDK